MLKRFHVHGGECAIKAERVCRLVLPGIPYVRTFEEWNPPFGDGGVGCPLVGSGVKEDGSEELREVGGLLGPFMPREILFVLCEIGKGL